MISSEGHKFTALPELLAHDGQRVILSGVYKAIALYQGTKRREVPTDHASIQLSDGSEVLLEPSWSEAARRGQQERTQFAGRQVDVEGIFHAKSPKPVEPVAYVTGPCLSPVSSIRLAPQEGCS